MATQQTYANHKRYVFGYHVLAFGGLMINLGWSVRQLARDLTGDRVVSVVLAATLILLFFYARVFALTAQDRVIRLEEQLRMARLLPDDLKPRISDLSPGQLIALRFASDAELPGPGSEGADGGPHRSRRDQAGDSRVEAGQLPGLSRSESATIPGPGA